jgi:low temperature requirement protein LtrA
MVSFLELFYYLVYVVLVAELSQGLSDHIGWAGLAGFAFLFVIVWWAWFNGTTYHDIHGNNDIRTRVFTFLQMLSVVAMAVFAHDALGKGSAGFAMSYAALQLILTYLWWRTGVDDPDHRPLSRPYSGTFLINTLLFVASAFVPARWRL